MKMILHHHHHHHKLNVGNISAVTDPILIKLVASWELLELLTVKVTIVQATIVLATFVHIRNFPAVNDLILMKL